MQRNCGSHALARERRRDRMGVNFGGIVAELSALPTLATTNPCFCKSAAILAPMPRIPLPLSTSTRTCAGAIAATAAALGATLRDDGLEKEFLDQRVLRRVVGDDHVAAARQILVGDVWDLFGLALATSRSTESVRDAERLSALEMSVSTLRLHDAMQRTMCVRSLNLSVLQLCDRDAHDLLLALDAARIAARVVPEARVRDGLVAVHVVQLPRLEVDVQVAPAVVVVHRLGDRDVDSADRVDHDPWSR